MRNRDVKYQHTVDTSMMGGGVYCKFFSFTPFGRQSLDDFQGCRSHAAKPWHFEAMRVFGLPQGPFLEECAAAHALAFVARILAAVKPAGGLTD